jgi:diguanylate cyclase (GGDEF)-like protein
MKRKPFGKRIFAKTIFVFLAAIALSTIAGVVSVNYRLAADRLIMENLIMEKSSQINNTFSRLLYKTEALTAFIIQGGGDIRNFDVLAAILSDDPAILNVLIAPDGVVSNVYPLAGNEAVLGLDFFAPGEGNIEAMWARDTGQLVLGGPFMSVQGYQIMVGRAPVYIPDSDGEKHFWGLVSITLRYPDVLDSARLDEIGLFGFDYDIWRINPDDGYRQVIAGSNYLRAYSSRYMELPINIHNASWYFRIYPQPVWYAYYETWITVFIGLGISFLIAFIAQSNTRLKLLRLDLKNITGTLNNMAIRCLAYRDKPFEEMMAMEGRYIADVTDVDRFSVWRNTQKPTGLHVGQIYRWQLDIGGTTYLLSEPTGILYSRFAPRWEKLLANGEVINSPTRLLPEADLFARNGTKSVLITPVFMDYIFWGFVIYEDHVNERFFEDEHVMFMHSAAFLFASAAVNNEMKKDMIKSQEEAEKIFYCALTGLYNRRFFDENLASILNTLSRSSGLLSLMMIDIDFFKQYNDTYGHSTGDKCLIIVAEALSQCITRSDDFVARYGGEEFVVVLPNTDENGARKLARDLLDNIRRRKIPHIKSTVADYVTISIGVTTGAVNHAQTALDYIEKADKLLYESKQNGRDRFTFGEI